MIEFRIKGINTYKSKGKRYYYDRVTGKRIMSPYGTPEFAIEVQAIRDAPENNAPVVIKGTLGALIHSYQMSPEFKALAPRTQKDYRSYTKDLEKVEGVVLAELTPPEVTAIRNIIAKKRTKDRANRVKTFLSTLFNWGIPNGHITHNPASKVPNLKKSREEKAKTANRPWTRTELQNFLDNTYPEMRTAIALAAWTSLREQDVIKVPWSAIDDGWIVWTHNKTGSAFEAPISPDLQQILDKTKKTAVTIVTGKRGNSYAGEDGFRANFTKERNRIAGKGLIGRDCTFHGLRHTILTDAAEEGATEAEIMSISGHKTESQVRRYTATAKRRKSAQKVISSLSNRGKKRT